MNPILSTNEGAIDLPIVEINQPTVVEKVKTIIPEVVSFISQEMFDPEQYYIAQGLDFIDCLNDD